MSDDYNVYLIYKARLRKGLTSNQALMKTMKIFKLTRTQVLKAIAKYET